MNSSPDTTVKGKIGELLVQLRLFQYGIESAIPVIDSGNDIIALKGHIVKSIQVKTKGHDKGIRWNLSNIPERYDILALVKLAENESRLDKALIYLLSKEQVNGRMSFSDNDDAMSQYLLSEEKINSLFYTED